VTNQLVSMEQTISVAQLNLLSDRERQVANLICCGDSNKIVAKKLAISEGTVKQYAHAIYVKLGVRSRYELGRRFTPYFNRQ
jgi:DNA-binding NarL/FixJ family response regulator